MIHIRSCMQIKRKLRQYTEIGFLRRALNPFYVICRCIPKMPNYRICLCSFIYTYIFFLLLQNAFIEMNASLYTFITKAKHTNVLSYISLTCKIDATAIFSPFRMKNTSFLSSSSLSSSSSYPLWILHAILYDIREYNHNLFFVL